jgi:tetratricopeptide (TPR) repeat protein
MNEVRIWEEKAVIPTYEVGKPDKNPLFLEKRVYQGSTGKIYPYPNITEISRKKTDHAWKAVWLENEYIKVMILPELGGRIQRAYDKTNDYDFVYYNQVIKPALVGLTGPWISGGIEFNWPQHHRPTTYSPVDYRIEENADGSKTLITGDVDQMYGTKEVTKFTLYPGKAYIEITGQLYNRTPLPQTFLWWANPAVSVNDYTQSIFPPDVHSVYDHGKRAVSRFPIATGEYYKHDYSEGVDISRYKNIPVPTSYMAEKSDYNFVGGYDYQKKAGLLHVADHHVSPGKKQWTWGCGDFGKAWDRNLTDEDGPYIELMTGMFCDNQPDFTWLKPYEEKVFKQYFMPYKAVGQVKNASIDAAVNLELTEEGIHVIVYATAVREHAHIELYYEGKKIYDTEVRLSPVDVYDQVIPTGISDVDPYKLLVRVTDAGKELVSYQAKDQGIPKLAEPAKAAKDPEEIRTNEELLLTGRHIEQYRHATFLPDPYYLEGLKRDEGDTRINTAYGMLLLRRGQFARAEGYFRKALERLTAWNPNPYDSEAYYDLGLALFYQEKYEDAYDAFYKATWTSEQQEMSFYYLAVLACRKGEYEQALEFIEKSLVKDAHHIKARGLKAMILRALSDRSLNDWIEENLALDAFDFVSHYVMLLQNPEYVGAFKAVSRNFHETYLNLGRDLAEAGFYAEAVKALNLYEGDTPMVHYYKSLYLQKMGDEEKAKEEARSAERANSHLCFPNKLEDIAALRNATEIDPEGSFAYYYLGCLYYDKLQFEEAIHLWEQSLLLNDTFPTLLRNLSIAYFNKCDESYRPKALELMEKAFALDITDARVFLELDQLYQKLQVSLDKRLQNYEDHIELIEKRDDLYTEYVTLLNSLGLYEMAYEAITRHRFQTWEGAEGKITTQFKVCLLERAKELLKENDGKAPAKERIRDAKELLLEALSYPENLGEGKLEGTKDNHIHYYLGVCEERLGAVQKAKDCFVNATLGAMEVAGMMYYYDQPADMILYQGLALQKLGRSKEANSRFYKLVDYGEHHVRDTFKMDYFAVSMPDMSVFDADMTEKNRIHCYYLMGLGNLGLCNKAEAAKWFDQALELDRNHQNAGIYRKMCEGCGRAE